MKVPPKRKGNIYRGGGWGHARPLNESPSEIVVQCPGVEIRSLPLNESPSEKEGKWWGRREADPREFPSMKVPPKRKGNLCIPRLVVAPTNPQ